MFEIVYYAQSDAGVLQSTPISNLFMGCLPPPFRSVSLLFLFYLIY